MIENDSLILLLLLKNNNIRQILKKYIKYLFQDYSAINLLNEYENKLKDSDKYLDTADLDIIFYSKFNKNSDEITLWESIKSINISNDIIVDSIKPYIKRKLKEKFFIDSFSSDEYDLDKLEELYHLLSVVDTECIDEKSESLELSNIDDCCNTYDSFKTDGVKFFDERVSNTLSSKQFDVGTVNVIIGAPGRGKTQLILNQNVYVASQQKHVLHIALGDLTKRQLILRLLAIISKKPIQQISMLDSNQFKTFMSKVKDKALNIFNYLHCKLYLPNTLTGQELIKEIEHLQKTSGIHYTQIVVDYDGNLETDLSSTSKTKTSENEKSMYYSGADIYNAFSSFAKKNNSVVWILSQPKIQYWNVEKIPLEGLSESSKKGQITDFCMSIGKKDVTEDECTLFISKNRHGAANKSFKLKQVGSNQCFEPIESL